MDYSILILTIIKMAILLGIGMFITYKLSFTQDMRRLMIFIIINISIPALIINSFFQVEIDEKLMTQMIAVFLFSFIFNFAALFIGWLIAKGFRFDSRKAGESAFLSTFCNAGLIGIPLCVALFGPKGALFAAIFDAGMQFSLWTLGVFMLQEKKVFTIKSLRSLITAPFIAILIGIIITVFNIPPVYLVTDVVSTLAGAASPLAMFYIGMIMMTLIQNKYKISVKYIYVPLSLKLIIFPIVSACIIAFLPMPLEVKQQLIVMTSLPSLAITSIIMAHNKADEKYGVIFTLFSTLISLVTIPTIFFISGKII